MEIPFSFKRVVDHTKAFLKMKCQHQLFILIVLHLLDHRLSIASNSKHKMKQLFWWCWLLLFYYQYWFQFFAAVDAVAVLQKELIKELKIKKIKKIKFKKKKMRKTMLRNNKLNKKNLKMIKNQCWMKLNENSYSDLNYLRNCCSLNI